MNAKEAYLQGRKASTLLNQKFMKQAVILSSLLFFTFSLGLKAQSIVDGEKVQVGKRSEIKSAQKVASVVGVPAQDEWMTVPKENGHLPHKRRFY